MKHAGSQTLGSLEPLIEQIRALPGLTERQRGIFYRGSCAFLHFHEDPAGVFADIKEGDHFIRLRVNNARERNAVLIRARKILGELCR